MRKITFCLILFLSLAFQSFASEDFDKEIENLKEEVRLKDEAYEKVKKVYDDFLDNSKKYRNKDGKFFSEDDARKKLIDVGIKLDEYVSNKTVSLEGPLLCAYFANGNKQLDITPLDRDSLYTYIKKDFLMKEGVDKNIYDELLGDFVNAISDTVFISRVNKGYEILDKEVKQKSKELSIAKDKLSDLVSNKKEILILKNAIDRAQAMVDSANYIMDRFPNTVKPVRADLEKLVKDQTNLIKLAKNKIDRFSI